MKLKFTRLASFGSIFVGSLVTLGAIASIFKASAAKPPSPQTNAYSTNYSSPIQQNQALLSQINPNAQANNDNELCVQLNNINQTNLDTNQVPWWMKSIYYHVYVRSFKDTNGDGEGDIKGLIESMPYLESINVNVLLFSPFYTSPQKDSGYDISDYIGVDPRYGTMSDVDNLINEAHSKNIRVLFDFVPNHSSDKHYWFWCSERALIEPKCAKYKDYYVWTNKTNYVHPKWGPRPNNWVSVFYEQSMWTWSDIRKEFYLHQFLVEQPDLNLRNELVVDELRQVIRFWLRKGVDGLRVDSALHVFEDPDSPDEPKNLAWNPNQGDDYYSINRHTYTRSLFESAKLTKIWRDVANEAEFKKQAYDDKDDASTTNQTKWMGEKIIISEGYDSIGKTLEYYGSPCERYSDAPFSFELLKIDANNIGWPKFVKTLMSTWIEGVQRLGWPKEYGVSSPWIIWVLDNHDRRRLTQRVGDKNAMAMQWLAYLVQGSPVSYYGDELGAHEIDINKVPAKTLDGNEPTRFAFRGPMAWTADEPSGNFSTTNDTWLPMEDNYKEFNVLTELQMSKPPHNKFTPLANFIKLTNLRKQYLKVIMFGENTFYENKHQDTSPIFSLARYLPINKRNSALDDEGLLMIANFATNNKCQRVNLSYPHNGKPAIPIKVRGMPTVIGANNPALHPPNSGQVVLVNAAKHEPDSSAENCSEHSKISEGDFISDINSLILAPGEAFVVKFNMARHY